MSRKLPYDLTVWKVSIPVHIAARVELKLPAPQGGKPRYGARSQLIASLLEDWLNDLENLASSPSELPEPQETLP